MTRLRTAQQPLSQQPSPSLSQQLPLQQLPLQQLPVPKVTFKRRDTLPITGRTLWKIHEGFVRIITWDDEGYVIPVSFWGPGSLIGAELILMHPYEVQCITRVLTEPVRSLPQLPAHVMVEQTHQALALLRILHCRHVDCRLLQFICWLAERFGHPVPEGHSVPIKITHQELADAIGTTRVTITRVLKQFELDGLLHWSAKSRVVYGPTLHRIRAGVMLL